MSSTEGEQVQGKRLGCVKYEMPVGHTSAEFIRQLDT